MSKLVIRDVDQNNLSEVGQTAFMLFGVLEKINGVYTNVTSLFKCRDYVHEMIYAQHHKIADFPNVYGFKWGYSAALDKQLNNDKYMDMVIIADKSNLKIIEENFLLIHRLENRMNIPLSKYVVKKKVECFKEAWKENNVFLHVKVPSLWWSNSVLISLYTELWRLCSYGLACNSKSISDILNEFANDYTGQDAGIVKSILKQEDKFWFFLDNWREVIGKVPQPIDPSYSLDEEDDEDIYEGEAASYENIKYKIHDGSGIQSLMNGVANWEGAQPAIRPWCKKLNEMYDAN